MLSTIINSIDLTSGEVWALAAFIVILGWVSISSDDPSDSVPEQCIRWFGFILAICLAIAAVLLVR